MSTILTGLATGIGFLGGWPRTPQRFASFVNSFTIISWVLVWILVAQGGGKFRWFLSAIVTFILFLVYSWLNAERPFSFLPQEEFTQQATSAAPQASTENAETTTQREPSAAQT